MSAPIEMISNGIASTLETQSRCVKSGSSGFATTPSVGCSGSSAIPWLGHVPGSPRRTPGFMGHIEITALRLAIKTCLLRRRHRSGAYQFLVHELLDAHVAELTAITRVLDPAERQFGI
jgi:hypothetical protein